MAMKTILVPIPDAAVNTAAIEIALMVAKAVAGHVEGLYIETPAPITPRTTPLAGYEATSYARVPAGAQLAEEEFARAAQARERVRPSRPGPSSSACAPRTACRSARRTRLAPCRRPHGARSKARTRAR